MKTGQVVAIPRSSGGFTFASVDFVDDNKIGCSWNEGGDLLTKTFRIVSPTKNNRYCY
jgi:hypothetical protein